MVTTRDKGEDRQRTRDRPRQGRRIVTDTAGLLIGGWRPSPYSDDKRRDHNGGRNFLLDRGYGASAVSVIV